MLAVLDGQGYLQNPVLHAGSLIVHPGNCSGMMLNAFDVHCKSYRALKFGWSQNQLELESYAMEVSQQNPVQEKMRVHTKDLRLMLATISIEASRERFTIDMGVCRGGAAVPLTSKVPAK